MNLKPQEVAGLGKTRRVEFWLQKSGHKGLRPEMVGLEQKEASGVPHSE